jgi:hypothetical protein
VEIGEVEAPAVLLAAAMLANDSVEPALEASREREILTINRQNERIVENAAEEPVGQDQFNPKRPTVRVGCFLPFVDQEKRCLRRSANCRIEVATVVDWSRSRPALRRW